MNNKTPEQTVCSDNVSLLFYQNVLLQILIGKISSWDSHHT